MMRGELKDLIGPAFIHSLSYSFTIYMVVFHVSSTILGPRDKMISIGKVSSFLEAYIVRRREATE